MADSLNRRTIIVFLLGFLLHHCVCIEARTLHTINIKYPQLFPEGFDWDKENQHFIVGSLQFGTLHTVSDAGVADDFITDKDYAGKASVLGITVDSKRSRVLAVIHRPSDPNGELGFNALAGYDLKSGKRVLFVELDQNAVANDVAVDPYGNAFVTNSAGNFIWKITLDGHVSIFAKNPIFTSQDIIVEDDLVRFCGLNGIVYNKRGALLVTQSNSGKLFEVDLHDGSVRLVQTSKTLPWADGITVRRDGVALVVSHHTAWFLKTRDNWGEATIVDEVPLNASRFATAITLREDDRAYVLNCYLPDTVKISRDVFSIEEIEFPKEAAGENVWLILLLVAGLLYVFFWRFQMQHFAKNLTGIVIWRIRCSPSLGPDATGGGSWKSNENCSEFIHTACSQTFHPELCMSTLARYPGVDQLVEPKDLVQATIEATIAQVLQSYSLKVAAPVSVSVAHQDCVELLHDTIYHLNATLVHMKAMSNKKNPLSILLFIADVKTWLSAALTNQDTCLEGLIGGNGTYNFASDIQNESLKFSQMISNSLALFQTSFQLTKNPRRMLAKNNAGLDQEFYQHYGLLGGYDTNEFPMWLSPTDRLLLQLSPADLKPDAVVAQDGSGNYVSITDAVKKAPSHLRSRKYIIYVKAGVYHETVRISKRKTNIMFVGDGKGKTVVVSSKNVKEGSTTFSSATFAASGAGFVARDMTFMNNAGPDKHQAVALLVGADFAAIYHCSIVGYQDTLYVHSLRQFYRECDIFGSVDFIFGNAAVVLKFCNIYARQGMANQKNTITAQGRNDPNQNTGISIQNCIVTAANDVAPLMKFHSTYLGRPWKLYSRTVYMQSFLGDLIHPAGWLEWSGEFALKSLLFGEYMNTGPGAILDQRVTWPGYRVIETDEEAKQYSVAIFISGSAVGSLI